MQHSQHGGHYILSAADRCHLGWCVRDVLRNRRLLRAADAQQQYVHHQRLDGCSCVSMPSGGSSEQYVPPAVALLPLVTRHGAWSEDGDRIS